MHYGYKQYYFFIHHQDNQRLIILRCIIIKNDYKCLNNYGKGHYFAVDNFTQMSYFRRADKYSGTYNTYQPWLV
jgi:hypothetical protein